MAASAIESMSLAELQELTAAKKRELTAEVERGASLQASTDRTNQEIEEMFQIFLPQITDEKRRQAAVAALSSTSKKLVLPYLSPLPFITAIATGTLPYVEAVDLSSNTEMDDDAAVVLAQALKFAPKAQQITEVCVGQTSVGLRGAAALMEAILVRSKERDRLHGRLRLSLAGCLPPHLSAASSNALEARVSSLIAKISELPQDDFNILY